MQGYLSRLLESHGFDVISSGPLEDDFLGSLAMTPHDILLVDWQEDTGQISAELRDRLENWRRPVVFNDSTATRISLRQSSPEFGRLLERQINTRLAAAGAASVSPDSA